MDERVLLERYELHDQLGRGGMATVFRALDRRLNREVAVKVFAAGTAVDDARRSTEATMLARLSHPHLVALHDAHLASDGDATPSFLVMELVDGEDLRSRLQGGPLPTEEAIEVAAGIAEALVVVHDAGMVHRDLKPGNILFADSSIPGGRPVVKLADFGIAHLVGSERITTIGTVIGTAGYLSPEQIFAGEPGPAADIYSLGLVVLESLTGVREYPGNPVEAVAARAARDPRIPASLPEDWRGLLAAMTARDPDLRPNAMEVAVMARELAPQLAGWAPEAPEDVATVPMSSFGGVPVAAAAGVTTPVAESETGPTRVLPARRTTRSRPEPRRRRGLVAAGAVAGSILVVASALALGSVMAPGSAEPQTVPTTPRPTPSVQAPPATVAPAVAPTQEPTQTVPQQPVQQAPAKQEPAKPAPGPGKDKTPPGKGKDKGKGKG
ncbi:protein kinase domain-containing protein [Leifsonia sp. RAF41]|uniref:serine/threonine-protein kinase n=1 Tax=Leifsonia sp. RAF41 TaxID=3233056 RepID=UPI003F9A167F